MNPSSDNNPFDKLDNQSKLSNDIFEEAFRDAIVQREEDLRYTLDRMKTFPILSVWLNNRSALFEAAFSKDAANRIEANSVVRIAIQDERLQMAFYLSRLITRFTMTEFFDARYELSWLPAIKIDESVSMPLTLFLLADQCFPHENKSILASRFLTLFDIEMDTFQIFEWDECCRRLRELPIVAEIFGGYNPF